MNVIAKTPASGAWRFNQAHCGRCDAPAQPAAGAHGMVNLGQADCWPRRFYCRRCDEAFTLDITFSDLVHFTLL